ncbi:N-acyl-D-amino-acid deacylase family protein [Brachybacterium saurashtrense]|uniref:N-acyl-D-aspartate/D-glutamate deacylase n=1 Tax=Brachybacterium saurashtrense TaxID=556288 RepID=A0A345YJU1_9MICO|nr:amidohydrolase family protein [Brachybacterium saurashtrense]AXK44193.1 N-acyl-D-aspartate/D-glutamate deacylase [Brachybacterium saurashtrense]RRR21465.1 N-acyl-D-aspartate/D-glutamate deacylase [Brachybacterium saurashtrense]
MTDLLLRGGHLVPGDGRGPHRADLLISGGRIAALGEDLPVPAGAEVLDAGGRLVVPGFVDAHSHADATVFDPEVQLALLRQGVTTVVAGQDGVSFAPGDGAFAGEYFAPINGRHPSYTGPRVADLLAGYDGRLPLQVAYLVPAGTVRHEVMGLADRPATAEERAAMAALVAQGVADGAVGLSTGLDYVPGLFAAADEIAALAAPLAPRRLPYVTHMRGGYELNAQVGVEEAVAIGQAAGVPVHISHFHTPAAEAARLLEWARAQGVATTFDAYPYTRGCSLLSMTMLPPALNAAPVGEALAEIADPAGRARLREQWFPQVATNPSLGPEWPSLLTIAHTGAPEHAFAPGLTLAEVAARQGTDAVDAALDLLLAARLDVNVVMAVQDQRPASDLGRLFALPGHAGGSDGIFVGAHPHPRARGTFPAVLATHVRERADLSWADAVQHLSTTACDLFALGDRGRLREGVIADLALVDPETVRDAATYEAPLALAEGIDDVLVGGIPVLADGRLTGALPGGGLRAAATAGP